MPWRPWRWGAWGSRPRPSASPVPRSSTPGTMPKERVQFGQPLSDFQATRFKLAEMATRITRRPGPDPLRLPRLLEGATDPRRPLRRRHWRPWPS